MLRDLPQLVLIVLGIIGIMEIVRSVTLFFLSLGRRQTVFFLIPVKGHREDIEGLLRSTIIQAGWMYGQVNPVVAIVDCRLDQETRELCDCVCSRFSCARFLSSEQLMGMDSG